MARKIIIEFKDAKEGILLNAEEVKVIWLGTVLESGAVCCEWVLYTQLNNEITRER